MTDEQREKLKNELHRGIIEEICRVFDEVENDRESQRGKG